MPRVSSRFTGPIRPGKRIDIRVPVDPLSSLATSTLRRTHAYAQDPTRAHLTHCPSCYDESTTGAPDCR